MRYFNTSSSANVGDPVSAGSSAYHFRMPLFSLGGPMNLGFDLIYGSLFFHGLVVSRTTSCGGL